MATNLWEKTLNTNNQGLIVIDMTSAVAQMMLRKGSSQLDIKLQSVFNDVYAGDELDFALGLIEGTNELAIQFPTATPPELLGLWADKQLKVLN